MSWAHIVLPTNGQPSPERVRDYIWRRPYARKCQILGEGRHSPPQHTFTRTPPRPTGMAPRCSAFYWGVGRVAVKNAFLVNKHSLLFRDASYQKRFRIRDLVQPPHLTQNKTEAQRGVVTCPRSHSSFSGRKGARAQLALSLSSASLLPRGG